MLTNAARREIRAAQRLLRDENLKWPRTLASVPPAEWPAAVPLGVERVLRSRTFLLQVFGEPDGIKRLSVIRSAVSNDGSWNEGISWDELQDLKAQAGFADREAVEVYPADDQVVNVANMRHLWVLPAGERLPFSWRQ